MQDCDLDVERVNTIAGDLEIWDRQLDPLLESAAETRTKPDWRAANTFAASVAQSMVPPTYYNPADWSKPEYQAQRRAEQEKQNREMGAYYEQAGKDQEARQNAEERERFARR